MPNMFRSGFEFDEEGGLDHGGRIGLVNGSTTALHWRQFAKQKWNVGLSSTDLLPI